MLVQQLSRESNPSGAAATGLRQGSGSILPLPQSRVLPRAGHDDRVGGQGKFNGDALLGESNHRIKNNLQLVASLLSIQARQSGRPETWQALTDASLRVLAVARLHEQLQASASGTVDLRKYFQALCDDIGRAADCEARGIGIEISVDDEELPARQASALGAIVHELVTNAIKHAYERRGGVLEIRYGRECSHRQLVVSDDGPGFNPGAQPGRRSLGLTLVRQLVSSLPGTLHFSRSSSGGLKVTIDFDAA